MHPTTPVLPELVVVTALALLISLVFQRLRLPPVSGFILTGAIVGPGVLGLISDVGTVRTLAEIGVVLLMFAVGLEFSLADLRALGARSVVAGALQIVFTAALVAGVLLAGGTHPARAVFFGLLVSLSSTALLLKTLAEQAELQAPHGRLTVGVLIIQDLALVPLTLVTPLLGGWLAGRAPEAIGPGGLLQVLSVTAVAAVVLVAAWKILPVVLRRAAGSREAFLAAIVLVVVGAAFLSERIGLSVALGAFLAGLVLAGTPVSSQVAADVLPFRDTLSSVFFISIGMLFDPRLLADAPGLIVAATAGLVVVKTLAATLAGRIARHTWPVAIAAGLALAHVGEFSFVLAQAGTAAGLLPEVWSQVFLAGALFSIVVAPGLAAVGPRWAIALDTALHLSPAPSTVEDAFASPATARERAHHVVIAGFGLNGRNVARVLRAVRIPHVVLDQASDKVAACSAEGSPTVLGNATQAEILHRAGVHKARVLVVALSDPIATRHAVHLGRVLNRGLFIVVRTRYVRELDTFYAAGANLVIPEEFETSIEIFTAVLRQFHVPNNIIEAQITLLRRERYSILRGRKLPGAVLEQLEVVLAAGTTETALVLQHSPAVGQTIEELGLAGDEATCRAIAIVRGGHAITDVSPGHVLMVGDTIVLTGAHAQIDAALEQLTPRAMTDPPA